VSSPDGGRRSGENSRQDELLESLRAESYCCEDVGCFMSVLEGKNRRCLIFHSRRRCLEMDCFMELMTFPLMMMGWKMALCRLSQEEDGPDT